MKVSMQITLDGLLRALRWQAHSLADDIAARTRAGRRDAKVRQQTRPLAARNREELDERGRR